MKCPRCKAQIIAPRESDRSAGGHGTNTYRRVCPSCRYYFTTLERVVHSKHSMKNKTRPAPGVCFEILIGDDEPGARKP